MNNALPAVYLNLYRYFIDQIDQLSFSRPGVPGSKDRGGHKARSILLLTLNGSILLSHYMSNSVCNCVFCAVVSICNLNNATETCYLVKGRCVELKRKKIGGAFDRRREDSRACKILIEASRWTRCLSVHGSALLQMESLIFYTLNCHELFATWRLMPLQQRCNEITRRFSSYG